MEKFIKFAQIAVVPMPSNSGFHHRIYALDTNGDLMFNDVVSENGDVLEPDIDTWLNVYMPRTDVVRDFFEKDAPVKS